MGSFGPYWAPHSYAALLLLLPPHRLSSPQIRGLTPSNVSSLRYMYLHASRSLSSRKPTTELNV
eukprot:scaffold28306_cov69-Cyclotella_meneghiniana.AAC.4